MAKLLNERTGFPPEELPEILEGTASISDKRYVQAVRRELE